MFDTAVKFEDVSPEVLADEIMMDNIAHFQDLQDELGYSTVWSIDDAGSVGLDFEILTSKPRKVVYKCIESMGDTLDSETNWIEFSSMAVNGSVGELWRAAESCFQQAKNAIGDWHYFIESFEVQEDGSLELWMGS